MVSREFLFTFLAFRPYFMWRIGRIVLFGLDIIVLYNCGCSCLHSV